jgi:hypothetical protein
MGEEFSPSTFLRAHIGDTPSKAARMNRMHFAYWNQGENNIMKQKALEAMAADDAKRWAAAEMFYGEGAGTRRKLLNAELGERFDDPVYNELFNNAYDKLDLNKFAQQAIKERKSIDRAAKAGRNFRAIKSGNLGNLSTGVFVVLYRGTERGQARALRPHPRRTSGRPCRSLR